jgi:flagellar export protein FliJ
VNGLRAEIRRIEQGGLAARRAAGARMGSGVAAAELHFAAVCQDSRQEFLAQLGERLNTAENEWRAQMSVFQSVERQMKIFENLRRRQYETFRLEETRREQKRMDELFLLRLGTADRNETPERESR